MINMHDSHTQKMIGLLILTIVLIYLLFKGGVAELLIVAALLSYILDPVVTRLEARGMNRAGATSIVLFGIIAIIVVAAIFLTPVLKEQLMHMQSGGNSEKTDLVIERLQETLRTKMGFLGLADLDLKVKLVEFKASVSKKILQFIVSDFISLIVTMVTIPFIMFFLLKDGLTMKKTFIHGIPNRYFEFTMDLLYKMDQQLGNYLRGQFTDALAFGILTTIALWLLGVPYFFFIGLFAGMANLIPYVGPIAGALLSTAVAVMDTGDVGQALWVVLTFAGLKLIDDTLIQPMVVSSSVDLHPLLVLLAILVGGHLFGIIGMLVAVPTTGFFKVVLTESARTLQQYRFT
ncbi:AI-2E family transporter [candidate division KSB1 bacterium]|nr:AI-2E family transporter [candidate division KSB1 bacterium]